MKTISRKGYQQSLVETIADYHTAVGYLNSHDDLVCDYETNGLHHVKHSICGAGVMTGHHAFYFPFRHATGNLPLKYLNDLCVEVLNKRDHHTGYNYKFDIKMGRKDGMAMPKTLDDPILAAHMMNECEPSFKMESIAEKYVDPDAGKSEDELLQRIVDRFGGSKANAKQHLWKMHPSEVFEYGTQDLITTRQLRDFYTPCLKTWGIFELYKEVCEYAQDLACMEMRGCQLDVELLHKLAPHALEQAARLREQIQAMARTGYTPTNQLRLPGFPGYDINPNSPQQLQAWLGTDSTDADTLALLDHPAAPLILEYRGWSKAESTYYRPYRAHMTGQGILHPTYNMNGTVTSRLSCADPNVMQIAKEGKAHYSVKDLFIPPPGYVIAEWDLSQAEIKMMAHYSEDPALLEIICNGQNMHDVVAKDLGIPRHTAKQLNLSAQYAIGPHKFATKYNHTLESATAYLKAYHAKFSGIKRFQRKSEAEAEKWGYVRMISGRLRHYPKGTSAYHAYNSLCQGSIAEIIRRIIRQISKRLPEVQLLFQVHDSVVGVMPAARAKELAREVQDIMEDQPWSIVKHVADCKIGPSWGKAM